MIAGTYRALAEAEQGLLMAGRGLRGLWDK